MKRISALVLVLSFLLTIVVFAEQTDKTEEVLLSVKSRIDGTDELDMFESSVEKNSDGTTLYAFYWSSSETGEFINAAVTESGIITYYYKSSDKNYSTGGKKTMNKPSADELIPKVQELVDKLNPELKGSIFVERREGCESLSRSDMSYKIVRRENGVIVSGDTGYVRVDFSASSIKNFNINYTENLSFDSPDGAVGTENAKAEYTKRIGAELSYRLDYENRKKTAYLTYSPLRNNEYIDALTGEAVKPEIYSVDEYFAKDEASAENGAVYATGSADNRKLSQAELTEMVKLASLISEDEARSALLKTGLITLPENVRESISLNRDYYLEDRYYYTFSFSADDFYASAKISANDGVVLMLRINSYSENGKKSKLSEKELSAAAEKTMNILAPGKTDDGGEFKLESSESPAEFYWTGYKNGIKTYFNNITLRLDEETGGVSYYKINEELVDYPSADNIMSSEKAAECIFASTDYSLTYIITEGEEKQTPKTALVYALSDNYVEIDPVTGACKNDLGGNSITDYRDISGHWSENAVKTLARFGIGFSGGEFKPDTSITEEEFISLVTAAVCDAAPICIDAEEGSYTEATALSRGVLKEGEEVRANPITRIKAALYFARALGYGDIAELDGIFKTEFSDVTESTGAAAILSALGVMKGTGEGAFSPNGALTRATAATMIYNYYTR